MSIRRRLVLLLSLIIFVSSLVLADHLLDSFRRAYSAVVENLMYEFANALASQVEEAGGVDAAKGDLEKIFRTYKEKNRTYGETNSGFDVYITDAQGILAYSSANPSDAGKDFSQWNDVHLALRGKYGARSTRTNPKDPESSVYFVAAPIFLGGKISGVITVIKSEQSVNPFLARAFWRSIPYLGIGIFLVGVFTFFVMLWITRPIHRLRDYALLVSEGRAAALPEMAPKELRELLAAFEKMRINLEGRKAIESFIQGLVHELKSPLTAIQGAAELSLESLPQERREKFLRNILDEGQRLKKILDELLRLAKLESQHALESKEVIRPLTLAKEASDAFEGLVEQKKIHLKISGQETAEIIGDPSLVSAAIRNVLLNALQFSPMGGTIQIHQDTRPGFLDLSIEDEGPGVPEYALDRIFERFYSLERPGGGEKSSGLGLNFVKEVMKLHGGKIELSVREAKGNGAKFTLSWPTRYSPAE